MNRWMVLTGGILIGLSAIPHALLGWPAVTSELAPASLDPEIVAGLAVGWFFGSAAMVAMGAVVVLAAVDLESSRTAWRTAFAVGVVYVLFGVAALVNRSGEPHFLGFIALGTLVAVGAFRARPRT